MVSFAKVMNNVRLFEDHEMTDFATNELTYINNPDVLEDFGELDHIFSDKTGTLTKNKLNFKEMSIINGEDQI
jgi:phospholipid-translocating ATPase